MAEWISVKVAVPPYERRVLVSMRHKNYPANDHIGLARRVRTDAKGEWWSYDCTDGVFDGVTFWHPLPDAPALPVSGGAK